MWKSEPTSDPQNDLYYKLQRAEQWDGFSNRFLGRNCRGAIPNSLDRNGNWQAMMDKKGKTPKELYEIGEKVLVQDVATRQWSKEGTVIAIRTAMDGI